jgi:hypothetical protein
MLLVLKYGYKQSRLFNLDSIMGNLMETIKSEVTTETIRTLKEAEKRWQTSIAELEEKIAQMSAKIAPKKDGDGKEIGSLSMLPHAKKLGSVNVIRGGKEADLNAVKAQIETLEKQISQYREKLLKIDGRIHEFEQLLKEDDLKLFDLADFTGERLNINRRLEQRAKGIVTANKPYYLVRLESADNPSCGFKPFAFEGYLISAPDEEGATNTEISVFANKKPVKGK